MKSHKGCTIVLSQILIFFEHDQFGHIFGIQGQYYILRHHARDQWTDTVRSPGAPSSIHKYTLIQKHFSFLSAYSGRAPIQNSMEKLNEKSETKHSLYRCNLKY